MSVSPRGQAMPQPASKLKMEAEAVSAAATPTNELIHQPAVSVVLPVYNEASVIERTLIKSQHWAATRRDHEFIFVDDGSTDATLDYLARRLSSHPQAQLRYVSSPNNGGKGAALRLGFAHCRGRHVILNDGDLAYSLDHLPVVAEALRHHAVVIGSRKLEAAGNDNRPALLRRLLGEGFNRLSRFVMGLPYTDTQAGLKGFHYDAAADLFPRLRTTGYAVDIELLYLAQRFGLSIGQVPAQVSEAHQRVASSVNLWRDPLRMARDMMRIRMHDWMGKYD